MGTNTASVKHIDPTAIVHETARIGEGTKIWSFAQVAEHAVIGRDCIVASSVYIDRHVEIGDRVWIQNKALLYQGVIISEDVFIGPAVCFTNDPRPRSGVRRDMDSGTWKVGKGASIGANATILPDIEIGAYAMVGAGAVVTRSVPDHTVVAGNPAVQIGVSCFCGETYSFSKLGQYEKELVCPKCQARLPYIHIERRVGNTE